MTFRPGAAGFIQAVRITPIRPSAGTAPFRAAGWRWKGSSAVTRGASPASMRCRLEPASPNPKPRRTLMPPATPPGCA